MVLQALADGQLTETASIFGNVQDPNSTNNTSSVTTEVDPATDLAVHIAASVPVAGVGEPFQYVVTATNQGSLTATGVVLSDTLPAGVSFVSATTDQGVDPTQTGGVVAVTFGTLAAGQSATLTIVVNPTAIAGFDLDRLRHDRRPAGRSEPDQ